MNAGHASMSHEQVALMMPAYIRGQLDTGQQRRIQAHIACCSACARRHREDLELAEAIASPPEDLELLLTSARRQRNRQRLLDNLATSRPEVDIPKTVGEARRSSTRLAALVAGLAAVSLGTVVLTQKLVAPERDTAVIYRTQTSASPQIQPATGGPTYKVMFRAEATLDSVQRLLRRSGAVVVAGPTENGVYTLAFPAANGDPDATLGHLRHQPEIVFAERSVHGDG